MEETKQGVQPTTPAAAPSPAPAAPPVQSSAAPETGSRTGLYAIIAIVVVILIGAGAVALMYSQKSTGTQYTASQPSATVSPSTVASPSASPINTQSDLNAASQTLDNQDTTQITNTLNQNTQDTAKF